MKIVTRRVRLERIEQRRELARLWGTVPTSELQKKFPWLIVRRKVLP